MLVLDGLEQGTYARRICDMEQSAAEGRDQQASVTVRTDAIAWQREADARIETQGLRSSEFPDDCRPVCDPQVARNVLSQTVDVNRCLVDEDQPPAVIAIEAASGADPHATGAILV